MKVLTKIKLLIAMLSVGAGAVLLFTSTSMVHASAPINTEVKEYKYESDDIYYSDGYFAHSATEYDEHLASLSILMTKFSMNPSGPDNLDDQDWFRNQSNRVKGYLETIGFEDFEANYDYQSKTGFSTIGVAAARKTVGDYTLISIPVRSGGYYAEWSNNVYLGDGSQSDYMHEGWYNAANKLLSFVDTYINKHNITGKIKLWMSGFSRGGAVTNLAAGLIDNKINDNKKIFPSCDVNLTRNDVYAYTFEAPQGANINSKTVKSPKDPIYNNIWNVVNPNDLVTKVAMSAWGFTRFGTDKFITTKFYDSDNFTENRNTFKKVYSMSNKDVDQYKGDNFEMKGITGDKYAGLIAGAVAGGPIGLGLTGYIMNKVSGIITKDVTKGNYDANIVETNVLNQLCRAIGSRNNYCKNFQSPIKDVLYTVMAETKEDTKERIKSLIISVLLESLFRSVGIKNTDLIRKVFPEFSDTNLSNIGDYVSIFVKVYAEKPNEIISTISYISEIFDNHGTNVNVAHIKAQDSYYINNYNKNHRDQIKVVSLRDNADMVRMSFFGYNDVKVKDVNNKQLVNVEGYVLGKSDVKQCNPGFAVGYYSYITEEKMELYLPVNNTFKVNFKSYSKKLRHEVTYSTVCQYITATNKTQNLPSGSDKVWFNSDRIEKTICVKP